MLANSGSLHCITSLSLAIGVTWHNSCKEASFSTDVAMAASLCCAHDPPVSLSRQQEATVVALLATSCCSLAAGKLRPNLHILLMGSSTRLLQGGCSCSLVCKPRLQQLHLLKVCRNRYGNAVKSSTACG